MRKIVANNNTIKKFLPYIFIMPSMILLAICLYGIINCILQAMGFMNVIGLNSFTFEYIRKAFTSKKFIDSFLYSLYIAFTQSILSILIGFLISAYLLKNKIDKIGFLYTPFAVPHLVVAMFMILLFAENGFFSRILCTLHIYENFNSFPDILYNDIGIGAIIAYVWKGVAYVLSVIYVIMKVADNKYYEVTKTMKISYVRYTIDILLPLTKRQLIYSFLILFSYSFGSYEIPFLLLKTTHKTLPVYAYEEFLNPDIFNRPVAQSYNLIMIIFGIIAIMLYYVFVNRVSLQRTK